MKKNSLNNKHQTKFQFVLKKFQNFLMEISLKAIFGHIKVHNSIKVMYKCHPAGLAWSKNYVSVFIYS